MCETTTFGDEMYGFRKALDKFMEFSTNGNGKYRSGGSLQSPRVP